MKNKILLGLISVLALTGCGPTSTPTDPTVDPSTEPSIEPSYPPIAPDEEFFFHDDIEEFYTNGKIESSQAADPFVFRANGWYYLYITTGGGAVRGFKSKDMLRWQNVKGKGCTEGYVYEYSKDSNPPASQTPYAPEVIYHNGYYYMVASPSGNGHYIFKSNSPEGPYKAITENIGHSIDGNFFIDSDHQLYMTYAGGGCINIAKMDSFTKIGTENGNETTIGLGACRVGSWNEGGFILQRDGAYYITFTGTHYLSSSYRVDYAYVPAGKSIFKSSSYENKGGVLLSTQVDNWRGLGHSSTVLGPDLDSYYIAYHNLGYGSDRYLNLSRLSFNGGRMVANYVGQEHNPAPNRPVYEVWDSDELVEIGDHYILDGETGDVFTAEWNAIGDGQMVFDYIDSNNYKYIGITEDLTLGLFTVVEGNTEMFAEATLFDDIDTSVLHTLRLGYKDGEIDVYFDGVEKINDLKYELTGGKIGYSNTYDEIGYTAFSDVAQGSSDQKAYNLDLILANAYDEKLSYFTGETGFETVKKGEYKDTDATNLFLRTEGNRATYRVYSPLDSDYNLDLRIPADVRGNKIGIRLDEGPIMEYTIEDNTPLIASGDSLVHLTSELYIPEGQHYLSIYNIGDEVAYSQIDLTPISAYESMNLTYNNKLRTDKGTVIGDWRPQADRIDFDSQKGVGYVEKKYFDGNYDVEAVFGASSFDNDGYICLALNAQEFSLDHSVDGANYNRVENYSGMRLDISDSKMTLNYVRFETKDPIAQEKINLPLNEDVTVKVEIRGKTYYCYLNDELVLEQTINLGTNYGAVGLLASKANGYFKSLSVSK